MDLHCQRKKSSADASDKAQPPQKWGLCWKTTVYEVYFDPLEGLVGLIFSEPKVKIDPAGAAKEG